jgi:hypothetical protein
MRGVESAVGARSHGMILHEGRVFVHLVEVPCRAYSGEFLFPEEQRPEHKEEEGYHEQDQR